MISVTFLETFKTATRHLFACLGNIILILVKRNQKIGQYNFHSKSMYFVYNYCLLQMKFVPVLMLKLKKHVFKNVIFADKSCKPLCSLSVSPSIIPPFFVLFKLAQISMSWLEFVLAMRSTVIAPCNYFLFVKIGIFSSNLTLIPTISHL